MGCSARRSMPPADGYTRVLAWDGMMAIDPYLSETQLRSEKDFVPISAMGRTPFVLAAHPSLAATRLREFIADWRAIRARSTTLSRRRLGHQMAMEALAQAVIRLVHVLAAAARRTERHQQKQSPDRLYRDSAGVPSSRADNSRLSPCSGESVIHSCPRSRQLSKRLPVIRSMVRGSGFRGPPEHLGASSASSAATSIGFSKKEF